MQGEVLADRHLIAPTVIVNRRPGIVVAEIRRRRRRTTVAVIAECQSQLPRVNIARNLSCGHSTELDLSRLFGRISSRVPNTTDGELDQLAHLKAALTGDAGQVLWDTDPVAIDSLSKLTTLLRSRFSGSRQADKCKMDLKLRRRKPGESLTSLH